MSGSGCRVQSAEPLEDCRSYRIKSRLPLRRKGAFRSGTASSAGSKCNTPRHSRPAWTDATARSQRRSKSQPTCGTGSAALDCQSLKKSRTRTSREGRQGAYGPRPPPSDEAGAGQWETGWLLAYTDCYPKVLGREGTKEPPSNTSVALPPGISTGDVLTSHLLQPG